VNRPGRLGRVVPALPHIWSVLLPVLLLGPALGRGYVLTYDMVFVPHLALRSDFLGAGGGLPRAVPSDAVVAVLDNVVPGMLLQHLLLLGTLVLLAQGMLRLVGTSTTARLVAVSLAVWNPFVVERLWIGHWPVLLGCAVLPWLILLLSRDPGTRPLSPWVFLLVPLGSLSASAGVATAFVLLLFGLGRAASRRRDLGLVLVAAAANAPWIVTGLLHGGEATPSGVGAEAFALTGDALPAPLSALGLGGIWNAEVVPTSREGVAAVVALVALGILVALGVRSWWRSSPAPVRMVVCWATGWVLAVVTWLVPGQVEWFGAHVPGGGLLRDGARYLSLCLPLVVVTASAGAERAVVLAQTRISRFTAVVLAAVLVIGPVTLMPDAAWGLGGGLRPVDFPSSWAAARSALEKAELSRPGDVLVLPFTSYRAPAWNGGRKVLDPLGRYLTPDYVVNDRLTVGGHVIPGDDPRVSRILRGLDQSDPDVLARTLRAEGIRYVVVDRTVPVPQAQEGAQVEGHNLHQDGQIRVVELPGAIDARGHSPAWWAAVGVAWLAYVGLFAVAAVGALRRRRDVPRRAV